MVTTAHFFTQLATRQVTENYGFHKQYHHDNSGVPTITIKFPINGKVSETTLVNVNYSDNIDCHECRAIC